MKKERPGELNQKIKRLRTSRDLLKDKNYEKSQQNKKNCDRIAEITDSRDHWKARSKELDRQKEELGQQIQDAQKELQAAQEKIQAAKEETELERTRADEVRKRADTLQSEIEAMLKKKPRIREADPQNGREGSA
jgi:chromosome segregation ATPase